MESSCLELEQIPFLVKWKDGEGGITQGPLTVLWELIESYKVDIFEISLSRITSDFLSFITLSQKLSINLGIDFTYTAANLVYMKSKALLPDPGFEEEEDKNQFLPKELVEKILEHKKFQLTGKKLSELELWATSYLERESNKVIGGEFNEENEWIDVSLLELVVAFHNILNKETANKEFPNLDLIYQDYSINDKIKYIEDILYLKKEVYFSELPRSSKLDNLEIVITFLAILEIVKIKTARLMQHKMFGDIKIVLIK
ncbi:MAG: segregation/condensation protein A [Leptospiraceae bacterium]|nr:segregation/condensation protein A [Leptospiraceae bacterium]